MAGALGLMVAAGTPADDTELFVANLEPRGTVAQPNILFVIDTSGSMATDVLTQAPWDPAVTWDGCFETDGLYFSTTSTRPDCGSNDWLEKSQDFCQDAQGPLSGVGTYGGQLLGWRADSERWVALNADQKSRPIECRNDAGIHGNGTDSRLWAANGAEGPWAGAGDFQPAWNESYTLWDGNWLNWNATGGSVTRQRLEIVQDATNQLIDSLSGVNVGLMRFHVEEGGPVLAALSDVDASRTALRTTIDELTANGWSPLSETLYEAGQYYAGRDVIFGDAEEPGSVAASRRGGDPTATGYRSPLTDACQKSYVVLLTDGAPSQDTSANELIPALPGYVSLVGPGCSGTGDGACLADMAEYLFKRDLDANEAGIQNVTTYTVGFTVDLPLLEETARRGGGEYFLADDTSSLAAALNDIVVSILEDAATFTAPTVPVNAFSRTRNLNDVYVSVFEPTGTMHWPGNLKKYRLAGGRLVGQDDQPAVDAATGFFRDDAISFWSPAADGNAVREGGAASRLPDPDSRLLYTDIAGGPLTVAGNAIAVANEALTAELIGAPAEQRDTVIEWFRGVDVRDEDDDGSSADTRRAMGDPLHVRPAAVIYGGSEDNPDTVVFTATNDGQLHAVDARTGVELWAYTPSRLLPRIYELYQDEPTSTKRYGLDSDLRIHVLNDDGAPGISGAERVILVFGMRRGGDSVFALDVTNRSAPVRLWEINGRTPGFADLGQTWSTPVVAQVDIGGTVRTVALFGGGYDDGQDNPGYRTDNVGNAVYMVELLTGAKLWSAGDNSLEHDLVLTQMTHSIPAPLSVLDVTQDGLADRIYVGDMGGRVWRFDIVNRLSGSSLVEGGVLASLGAAALPAPQPLSQVRRFYASPDIVPVVTQGTYYLTINLGSGFRAHPLDTATSDAFYSIRDFRVLEVIDSDDYLPPLRTTALVDVTNNPDPTLLISDRGWRLRLVQAPGEKVLNRSMTFQNTVFFTSFSPGAPANSCIAGQGVNRLYQVNVSSGAAVTNLDQSIDEPGDPLTVADRSVVLQQRGIAPEAVFIFPDDAAEQPALCIGVECLPPQVESELVRTFWTQDGT
jgi:type IV pilus assembly protein PilY1